MSPTKMKRALDAPNASPNAFALLMGSEKKKKKRQSQYFECPAGCGKSVPGFDINRHLDVCMSKKLHASSENTLPRSSDNDSKVPPYHEQPHETTETVTSLKTEEPVGSVSKDKEDTPSPHDVQKETTEQRDVGKNAFSHMMQRSAKVFASSEVPKLAQRFHLNADGSVELTCYSTCPGLSQPESIEWSAATQMKVRSKQPGNEFPTKQPTIIELIVSSSIPSFLSPTKTRLVKKHSRLSIPVLKSILQKSIRRRRPFPSVRVAMELADKSIGELLRRLPIIILEDSTLHPAFPLLTWLMVADSKGYELPPSLMVKVLASVYEMCSCRLQDHLQCNVSEATEGDATPKILLSSYHREGSDHVATADETLIWSILLRAQYGGMKCDMRMLRRYADAWTDRFSSGIVPETAVQRLSLSTLRSVTWSNIPYLIHQSALEQSHSRVGTLCQQEISFLTMGDISIEGIDFHCSSVLDSIMNDRELVEMSYKRLAPVAAQTGLDPIPSSNTDRRSWLESVLKSCMWNYASGVNRRLPLMVSAEKTNKPKPEEDELLGFWKELIYPRAKVFAERYIKDRL